MNKKTYIVCGAISLCLYAACAFAGALINVLISYTAGFRNYADFKQSDNVTGFLLVICFTLINHVFFAWLTVKLISRYAKTRHRQNIWLYVSAAMAALIYYVLSALLGHIPGILTILIHISAILLFGAITVRRQAGDSPKKRQDEKDSIPLTCDVDEMKFCHVCGCEVPADCVFCHKCGAKIR